MPPPSRKGSFPKLDFLSNLPPEIIANILGRLLTRQAIQTCILSRQWRYKWCSLTRLHFDDGCVTSPDDHNYTSYYDIFARFIDRVLLYHQGPVHDLTITTEAEPCISDLNQWVYFASQNNVRKLFLRFECDVRAPSSLFQCSKLTALHLSYCEIPKLPVGFDGFMSLKTLHLEYVKIPSSLEKLISGCPILESLEIFECHLEVFRVHAPLLKYLRLQGYFDGFFLEKTSLLRELTITVDEDPHFVLNGSVIEFLDHVPSLEKLNGSGYLLKICSLGENRATSAITHDHLRSIDLDLNFEDPTEVLNLLKLMDRSPVLEYIRITSRSAGTPSVVALGSEFWSRARDVGCEFLQLKKVHFWARGSTDEAEFMKLLLLNSPALEKMFVNFGHVNFGRVNLRPEPQDGNKKVVAALLRCCRASRTAEVICSGF